MIIILVAILVIFLTPIVPIITAATFLTWVGLDFDNLFHVAAITLISAGIGVCLLALLISYIGTLLFGSREEQVRKLLANKDYAILSAYNEKLLMQEIAEAKKLGFLPTGGVSVSKEGTIYQAVSKSL